jgi:hypothetical protein
MQGLIEAGGERADWARRQLFAKYPLTLGLWVGMLRDSVNRYANEGSVAPESP